VIVKPELFDWHYGSLEIFVHVIAGYSFADSGRTLKIDAPGLGDMLRPKMSMRECGVT
jgi:hypothetical protein